MLIGRHILWCRKTNIFLFLLSSSRAVVEEKIWVHLRTSEQRWSGKAVDGMMIQFEGIIPHPGFMASGCGWTKMVSSGQREFG